MSVKVLYGIENKYIDITERVLKDFTKDDIIKIPANDCIRASIFTDPCFGLFKHIVIIDKEKTIYFCNAEVNHKIDFSE